MAFVVGQPIPPNPTMQFVDPKTGKFTTSGLQVMQQLWLSIIAPAKSTANVLLFGAKGDGVTDDTVAIQNTINSLSTGGEVWFPPGNYKISNTLTVGNGNGSTINSTIHDITLRGLAGWGGFIGGIPNSDGVVITSSFAGPAIKFAGPIIGCGITHIGINVTNTSTLGVGLLLSAVNWTHIDGLFVSGACGFGIQEIGSCETNVFRNVYIFMNSTSATQKGIRINAGIGASSDVFNDSWYDVTITPTNVGHIALSIGNADELRFYNLTTLPGSGGAIGIEFDYSVAPPFPGGLVFFGVDLYNNTVINTGTPPAPSNGSLNVFDQFAVGNGAVVPSVTNVSTPGLWVPYTPTITAGAGTFTTVSAVGSYMIMGRITFINVVVTVTAVGTASGQILVSYPSNIPAQNQNTALAYADTNSGTGTVKGDATQMQILPTAAFANIAYRASGFIHTI